MVDKLIGIDKTPDKRYVFRICQMYAQKEASLKELKMVFNVRCAINKYLTSDIVDGKDLDTLFLENKKGNFRSMWYNSEDSFAVWKSTIIYEDKYVTINKPNTFEESHSIGNPMWCFCYKYDKWIQHNNIEHETIYFVHGTMLPSVWEYNAVCVLQNGDRLVIDKNHHNLSRKNGELSYYLNELGKVALPSISL